MSVKATIEIRDVICVWIEFRAPKKGELMWSVPADSSPEEALDHVLTGRDVWASGEAGFGCRAYADMPEFESLHYRDTEGVGEEPMRNIIVHVDHVRTEPGPRDAFNHIKLL